MYYPYTQAQYGVTVRDPQGTGSGWAGEPLGLGQDRHGCDHAAGDREVPGVAQPRGNGAGRYTTILEPQAVYQLIASFFGGNGAFDRPSFENNRGAGIFAKKPYISKLGEVVVDERLTVEMDPMDPELAHVPFCYNDNLSRLEVYHPARWIDHGVLVNLPYDQAYAMEQLGKNAGLPSSGAFRMRSNAPPVSMEDMIATTTRGLLVTRFDAGYGGSPEFTGTEGYTRDGLWLIEKGKIAKPVKNFRFEENTFSLLQPARLEQVGAPVRVFVGDADVPMLIPPLKVKDFNFTQLADAV